MIFKGMRTSFKNKILIITGASVLLSLVLSNVFALISVQSLGNTGRGLIDSSLRKANIEYIENFIDTTRLRINLLLDQTKAELSTVASVMQNMIDHPSANRALGSTIQSLPEYADKLEYKPLYTLPDDPSYPTGIKSGDWVQNTEPAPSVVGVWSYLLDGSKAPKPRVSNTIIDSKVFDLIGPAILKNGSSKLQIYYMGDKEAPIMRLTPYTDIAGTFDKLYNGHNYAPFWGFFFPGTAEGWNQWKTNPETQPIPSTDVTVSYPYIDAATGNYIVSFFQPLWTKDRKQFAGAVAIDITLEQVSNLIRDVHIANTGFAYLVLSDTNVLAMPKIGEAKLGLETTKSENTGVSGLSRKLVDSKFESIKNLVLPKTNEVEVKELVIDSKEGEVYTVAQAHLEGMNFWADSKIRAESWTLGFIVPNSEIYSALSKASSSIDDTTRNLVILQAIIIVASLLIITFIVWPITNRMTHGLSQLMTAIQQIEKKDYNITVPVSSSDEIGVLAKSFNSMTQEILKYTSGLEQIVKERTKEIELLNARLKDENLRLGAEVDVARRLQMMVLPKLEELQAVKELDIAAYMQPADEVGGDYYDVLQEHGLVKIGIGDVTGHGLESGVLMIMVQTVARTLLDSGQYNPVTFLTLLNEVLYKNIKRIDSEKNLSLSFLDYTKGKLTLTGQHEELLILHADGSFERIDTMDLGFPIGLEPDIKDFVSSREIPALPGDTIVLFTDGITEALNPSGKMLGIEHFIEVLVRNRNGSAETMKDKVLEELKAFIGTQKIYDDISLVIIKQK